MLDPQERKEKTWTCPDCGAEVGPIEFPPFGYIQHRFCPHCDEGRRKEAEAFDKSYLHEAQRIRWLGDSNLDPDLSFENYPGRQKATALNYVQAAMSPKHRGWLWIHGPHGTHKTHLANAIGMHFLNQAPEDPHVRMLDWRNFLSGMRAEWNENPMHAEYPHEMRQARKAKLLILTSVADLPCKVYAVREFVNLLANRSRSNRRTIFVSALPFESKRSPSILSRMQEAHNFEIDLLVSEWQAIHKKEITGADFGLVIYTGR